MRNAFVNSFSLTAEAEQVIKDYCIAFGIKSKSKALNQILIEYFEKAEWKEEEEHGRNRA